MSGSRNIMMIKAIIAAAVCMTAAGYSPAQTQDAALAAQTVPAIIEEADDTVGSMTAGIEQ